MAAIRLVHHADPVAQSHAAVKLYEGGFFGDAGISIRHRDGDSLLQGQNVLEPRILINGVQKALLNGARVAEHKGHAVGEELFDDCKTTGFIRHCPLFHVNDLGRIGRAQARDTPNFCRFYQP